VSGSGPEFRGDFAAALAGAQSGEAWALRALFDWLGAPVAGFLRSRGAHDPDGSANEVFLRAFRTVHTFRGDAYQFRTWVFTITRNLLIDERRKAARRVELVFDDGTRSPRAEPTGNAEDDALSALGDERVAELLAVLSPEQREVIALRVIADLSFDQVAAITGRGYEAVKALHRRGIATLARTLEREGVPR
jgi:RNA polymerase sigma factor (sigma-70 family)